jgi:CheY-like chemotaxis protein
METPVPTPGAKQILVIDANKTVRNAMSFLLGTKGYLVMTAETGAEALRLLHRNKPDLILLELDFPPDPGNICSTMRDGFLILDWARRMDDAENIPVIIVSALDPETYRKRALAHGIQTFFRKPVDKEQLLGAVHAVLADSPA